ncbi:MAG: cyclodeaminase/cyclohydrolase family protein [Planctomycetota bacterium]
MDAPLTSLPFGQLLDSIAAKTPTPGGGAVAGAVGALSAALAGMVVSYSVGKKSLAAFQDKLVAASASLVKARTLMLRLADEDAAAYGLVNELSRLAETDERRTREWPAASMAAVQVPMAVIAASTDLLRHFEELTTISNRHLRSDLAIAAVLAEATARAGRWNVVVNVGGLDAAAGARFLVESGSMVAAAAALCAKVEKACAEPAP